MRRHDTDVTSMVFGLVFLGVAAGWLLVDSDRVSVPELAVLGPVVLLVAGVLGLVATIAGSARARRQQRPALPGEGVQHVEDGLADSTDHDPAPPSPTQDVTQQLQLGPREES